MIDTQAIIATLAQTPNIIIPLVRETPQANLRRQPVPGKWSVHEHACHLALVHPIMSDRLEKMLSENVPLLTPYEPSRDEQEGSLLDMDLDDSLNAFRSDREALLTRLRELESDQWERTAEHPEYSHYSIFIMFRHLAMHDMFHAYRIEELLLNPNWNVRD